MSADTDGRAALIGQLDFIEQMILEGRRTTERWGWTFVLWGVGHAVAILWSELGRAPWAWGVCMGGCGIVMGIASARRGRKGAQKTAAQSRSLGAIWQAFSISLGVAIVASIAGGSRGYFENGTFYALFFVLMGAANYASGAVLRWTLQRVAAVAWWGAALGALLAPVAVVPWLFLGMAVVGEIGFGAWLMVLERREPGLG
jgi:hypothetical protein